jgi:hypothetical protein
MSSIILSACLPSTADGNGGDLMTRCAILSAALFLVATQAFAQSHQKPDDMGTAEQRAACSHDVGRFCKKVKPEEGPFAYLNCLQEHREKLRPACVRVISGGNPM